MVVRVKTKWKWLTLWLLYTVRLSISSTLSSCFEIFNFVIWTLEKPAPVNRKMVSVGIPSDLFEDLEQLLCWRPQVGDYFSGSSGLGSLGENVRRLLLSERNKLKVWNEEMERQRKTGGKEEINELTIWQNTQKLKNPSTVYFLVLRESKTISSSNKK